ncbi:MAG: prolyl-tRNA synthetase associated domain-containing protein [Pseudomonadota bacterium]
MTDQDDRGVAIPADDDAEGREAEAALYGRLDALGIAWTHHYHPPMRTVADSRALRGEMPGLHLKNMFLKEKKGGFWLVSCLEDRQFRIRDLERAVGAKGTSFGKPDLLWETLGVRPGAVTPFAVMNAAPGAIRLVLDAALVDAPVINAHPMHNRATTAFAWEGLYRFLDALDHLPQIVDFAPIEAASAAAAEAAGHGSGRTAPAGAGR